jgi:hypothetical protein
LAKVPFGASATRGRAARGGRLQTPPAGASRSRRSETSEHVSGQARGDAGRSRISTRPRRPGAKSRARSGVRRTTSRYAIRSERPAGRKYSRIHVLARMPLPEKGQAAFGSGSATRPGGPRRGSRTNPREARSEPRGLGPSAPRAAGALASRRQPPATGSQAPPSRQVHGARPRSEMAQ